MINLSSIFAFTFTLFLPFSKVSIPWLCFVSSCHHIMQFHVSKNTADSYGNISMERYFFLSFIREHGWFQAYIFPSKGVLCFFIHQRTSLFFQLSKNVTAFITKWLNEKVLFFLISMQREHLPHEKPFWYWNQSIPWQLGPYHSCRLSGSFCPQAISNHGMLDKQALVPCGRENEFLCYLK